MVAREDNCRSCCGAAWGRTKRTGRSIMCAPCEFFTWLRELCNAFGLYFILALVIVQHLLKGLAAGGGRAGLVFQGLKFSFKEINVDASRITTLTAAAAAPWSMKPLLGFVVDTVPLGGYSKRWWIVLVTLPAIAAAIIFGSFGAASLGADAIAALVFIIALQFATCDLLSEAVYAQRLQSNPEHGPALMSFVWAGVFVASLVSTTISGAMLEWAAPQWSLIAAVPFVALPLLPAAFNWLGETRWSRVASGGRGTGHNSLLRGDGAIEARGDEEEEEEEEDGEEADETAWDKTVGNVEAPLSQRRTITTSSFDVSSAHSPTANGTAHSHSHDALPRCITFRSCFERNVCAVDCAKARSQRKLFALSLCMGFLAIAVTAMQTFGNDVSIAKLLPCEGDLANGLACKCGDEIGQIISASIVGVLVLVGFWSLTPRPIAKVQTFFFITNVFTVSVEGGAFYFFTDNETAFPDGPHFSNAFYVTVIGVVSNLFALLGIWSYNTIMWKWKYRRILFVANLAFMVVNVLSAAVYLRWNRIVGIPDDVFVIGSDAAVEVVYLWTYMPSVVIMSQLCPHGVEATMYALLAGSSNFGQQLASSAGGFTLCMLGVQPTGGAAESAQFDNLWIAALISALLPTIPLLFLPFLIPDAKQTDVLLPSGEVEESDDGSSSSETSKKRAVTWAAPGRRGTGGMSFSFSSSRVNKQRGASDGGAVAASASYGALRDGE